MWSLLTDRQLARFLSENELPSGYRSDIQRHFVPLVRWIARRKQPGSTLVAGLSGAQGSGKTTLAGYLEQALKASHRLNVATLSLDDFYLGKARRQQLAATEHPLLETRGVPGTHDIAALNDTLDQLSGLKAGAWVRWPRFDKLVDDRKSDQGCAFRGPADVVLLEGWCVGTPRQTDAALETPLNELERVADEDGAWRRIVNDRLASHYEPLWQRLDALIMLRVPDFAAVRRWRGLQEEALRDNSSKQQGAQGLGSAQALERFVQHFERLTRHSLDVLPGLADVVCDLDANHRCERTHYRD